MRNIIRVFFKGAKHYSMTSMGLFEMKNSLTRFTLAKHQVTLANVQNALLKLYQWKCEEKMLYELIFPIRCLRIDRVGKRHGNSALVKPRTNLNTIKPTCEFKSHGCKSDKRRNHSRAKDAVLKSPRTLIILFMTRQKKLKCLEHFANTSI